MQFEYLEQWTSLGNTTFASIKELGEINAKVIEKFTQQQLEFVSLSFNTQLNLFSDHKELFSGLAKLIAEHNEKVLETVRKTAGIMTTSS